MYIRRNMVISAEEKRNLLERLQKARESKAAKASAKKKEVAADVKEPEPPAPAPVVAPEPVPAPAPVPVPVPVPEQPQVQAPPEVPDLVEMSKKKPAKKKKCIVPSSSESDSDSDSEAKLPPKKGKGKKQAYMKIKIYKEPKNAVALQSLVEAIQDEQDDEIPPVSEPIQIPQSASVMNARTGRLDIKNATPKATRTLPSAQELMRRAALEFFS